MIYTNKCKNNKTSTCISRFRINVEIPNSFNPELQLRDTECTNKSKLIDLLTQLKGFKFVIALVLVFKKIESEEKTNNDNFYSSSKAEIIINESDIDHVLQSIIIITLQHYNYNSIRL